MMKLFDTKDDFKNHIKSLVRKASPLLNEGKPVTTLRTPEVVEHLDTCLDLIYEKEVVESTVTFRWYYRNYDSYLYNELTSNELKALIRLIAKGIGAKNYDLAKIAYSVVDELNAGASYDELKAKPYKKPPWNYVLTVNGIFNLKSAEFYTIDSDKYKQLVTTYHFFNNVTISYYEKPHNKSKFELYKTYMDSLCNGEEDLQKLLKQGMFAVIEGNGRHKYFMISGDPGIGKSTLGYLFMALAGQANTKILNIDKLANNNAINAISPQTRLIIGDDLKNNAKISDDAITNYKILVDGNALSAEVKYEHNRIIKTNAFWLQMMNEAPRIYEAGEAITDRTIFIHLKGKNHRNDKEAAAKEMAKRLDDYLGRRSNGIDQEFINEIASDVLRSIKYFDEFDIPESIKKATANMVNENNWMHQFIEHATEVGLFEFNTLKRTTIISCVELFLRENNPGMTVPSAKNIIKEWKKYLKDLGYKEETVRQRSLPEIDYNADIIKNYMFDGFNDKNAMTTMYSKTRGRIDDKKIKKFKNELEQGLVPKELSIQQMIILEHLISTGDLIAASYKTDAK